MNRVALLGRHRTESVNGLTEHIHHATQRCASDRDRDRSAQRNHLHAAHDALGRRHRHGAHAALTQVLCDFRDDVDRFRPDKTIARDPHRVMNFRQMMLGKLHVDDRADDLHNVARASSLVFGHL